MSTAIVTGASRGLGLAVAGALAGRGWDLVIDARGRAPLDEAATALRAHGVRVAAIAGDMADPSHVAALAGEADHLGGLRLVVNNASYLGPSPQPRLADYPLDVLEEVFLVNVIGPLRLIQATLPTLREGGGTVVNVTSDAAVEAYEAWGGYGSSKAALEQMSNVLAAEEDGVAVFWLDPGDMNTRMHQEAFPGEDISDRPAPETRAPAVMMLLDGEHPSGRYTASGLLAGSTP